MIKPLLAYSILFLFFLSGCSLGSPEEKINLKDQEVEFRTTRGQIIWKGVFLNGNEILTVSHVYDKCRWNQCIIWNTIHGEISLDGIVSETRGDALVLKLKRAYTLPKISEASVAENQVVMSYRDGEVYTGILIHADRRFLALDTTLSWSYLTGAEIDIVFSSWDSGTPVWTLSWGLIWVISATNREEWRSWSVR